VRAGDCFHFAGEGFSFIINCVVVIIYIAHGDGPCHGTLHGCHIISWGCDSIFSF